MKILTIDCSQGNHLVLIDDKKVFERKPVLGEKKSDNVLLYIDELLNKANLKLSELDALSICIGPGSWTGLRVGVSLAKGLIVATKIKVLEWTSFEAVEYNEAKDKTIFVIDGFGSFVWTCFNGEMKCEDIFEVKNKILKLKLTVCCDENVAKKLETENYVSLKKDLVKISIEKFKEKKFINIDKLEPLYLRASQAEIERDKKLYGN